MLTNNNTSHPLQTNSKLPTSTSNTTNCNKSNLAGHISSGGVNTNLTTGNTIQPHPHPIPPRYQPPPQPTSGHVGGGILKNFGFKQPSSYYQHSSDLNHQGIGHINLKYPPEVPKLTNIYLPENLKSNTHKNQGNCIVTTNNQSRLIPPRAGTGGLRLSINTSDIHSQSRIQNQVQTNPRNQSEDIDFIQRHHNNNQEMLKFVRKSESDPSPTGTNSTNSNVPLTNVNLGNRLSPEQNRQLQNIISELRVLKEANQRLSDDNQELRDLCCFLDDDRQKGRKLAREWQRFGRYTASVMRQEVSAYQSKLRQLDDKQQELIRDNLELKELCLYLDEERANASAVNQFCVNCRLLVGNGASHHLRDDGDGSSSSTIADDSLPHDRSVNDINIRPSLSDQTLQYVRSLESRIQQLEEEKEKSVNQECELLSGRPEAVVRALQVLEVREQLERDRIGGNVVSTVEPTMDDGAKALVREMCNVVWRKLEDGTNEAGVNT